jgi:3-hydroxyisobutyrate dehydrogenase
MKIGFIGLGVMGEPMAGHLLSAGNDLWIWNRTASKMESLASKGAKKATSLQSLAKECDVVCSCLGRTEDVMECLYEATKGAKQGTLFIDHSTISPDGAVEIGRQVGSLGLRFVDAPITGGSMGAKAGKLTIFLGGNENAVKQAIEVIKPYTKTAARVGESGAGQKMKLANQIAVGGALIGLCECLAFAEKSGLDIAQAREVIGGGAGGSWAFENYGPKILNHDWTPGFSIKNQRKDFGYCAEAAKEIKAQIPCTELVNRLLGELENTGRGEQTTAALYDLLIGG